MITQAQLKDLFSYCPATGLFTRIVSRSNRVKVGDVAGTITRKGYRRISINDKGYLAHRLAWLYMHDFMPVMIDHKDRNPSNNRIGNLRIATESLNAKNAKIRSDNTSGVTGVCFGKRRGTWFARINHHKRIINLGTFATKEEAIQARRDAEKKYSYMLIRKQHNQIEGVR